MKLAFSTTLALLLVPSLSEAQTIERYQEPGLRPSLILQGVALPAGTEMLVLSGRIAVPSDRSREHSPTLSVTELGDTRAQTISALGEIKVALAQHGYTMFDVIKLTVFIVGDPAKGGKMDYAGMNEGYRQFFGTTENPNITTRSTVQVVALAAPSSLIEIEATAAKQGPR